MDLNDPVLQIFQATGALLQGHFILRSGRHSEFFFQCARVCEHLDKVTDLAKRLRGRLPPDPFATVISPAMGGLVIGQELARQAGARFIFAEKEAGALVLRRNFVIRPQERILVVEDVITEGGRVRETLDIVRHAGGIPVGVAVLVDRGSGETRFDVPCTALLRLSFPTWAPDSLPPHLAEVPASKPGS